MRRGGRSFFSPGGRRSSNSSTPSDSPAIIEDDGHFSLFGPLSSTTQPTPDDPSSRPYQRKRQRKTEPIFPEEAADPFASLHIVGCSASIHEDDIVAMELDSGKAFIPWIGIGCESQLFIDRYDVRALLDDLRPHIMPKKEKLRLNGKEEDEEKACEEERYKDMESLRSEGIWGGTQDFYIIIDEFRKRKKLLTVDTGYHSVPYSYGTDSSTDHKEEDKASTNTTSKSNPTFVSDAHRIVLESTAKFVAECGGEVAENRIKESQKGNPYFEFLNESHEMNQLYSNLKKEFQVAAKYDEGVTTAVAWVTQVRAGDTSTPKSTLPSVEVLDKSAAVEEIHRRSHSTQSPPDITKEQLGVIDKMAEFVVRCGKAFEDKVLEEQRQKSTASSSSSGSTFNFLLPSDPHHAYYQSLVRQKLRAKR